MWCAFASRLTQVLFVTLCVLPSRADAQPSERQYVALHYRVDPASSDCPSEEEFRARLSSRLGYDPHRPDAARKVEVITRPTTAGLEGVIRWTLQSDRAGPRVFDSPTRDCAPLSATMAFVLAVQIQLMASDGEPPLPAPKRAGPPATADVPAPEKVGSGRESDVLVISAGGGPSVGVGLAPEFVAQGRLFVAAKLGSAALELAVEASAARTATFALGTGFRHELRFGSLAACSQQGPLALCVASRLGLLEVTGVGVDRPSSSTGLLVQVGPRVACLVPLSKRLGLLAHVDASYLLSPWVVRLDGAAIWSVPRFSTVVGIDVALHFH